MTIAKELLRDVFHQVYPNLCLACGDRLKKQESSICLSCQFSLPQTNFHMQADNPVAKHFWGRVKICTATAFLGFSKGGRVQRLIHQLKYNRQKELGIYLGHWFGQKLLRDGTHEGFDYIIPVPLHPRKIRKRGYNQSDLIAEGLSKALNVPWSADYLIKGMNNESQTSKSRIERWRNVEHIYQLKSAHDLKGKKVLLVDDVITTGATLEGCAQTLLAIEGLELHIASLACAQRLL